MRNNADFGSSVPDVLKMEESDSRRGSLKLEAVMEGDTRGAGVEAAQHHAQPANPMLASVLLDLEEKQRLRFCGPRGAGERVATGFGEIDGYVLGGGGFERGILVGLSDAEGGGRGGALKGKGIGNPGEGRLISIHLICSILLAHSSSANADTIPKIGKKSKATIIHTTDSFPLALLAKVLRLRVLNERVQRQSREVATGNYPRRTTRVNQMDTIEEDKEVNDEVQRCLEMVAITRVFDIEGLWEVLDEEGRDAGLGTAYDHLIADDQTANEGKDLGGAVADTRSSRDAQLSQGATEIVDSQEENTDLLGSNATKYRATSARNPISLARKTGPSEAQGSENDEGTEIIVVDNMTHIINELFARKEKNAAHNLLTALSRTMHTLSHTNNILTILHNTTTSSKPSAAFPPNPYQSFEHPHQTFAAHDPAPSIFASNPLRPSLGRIFNQFPDLHILLSHIPKSRDDAEILYGQDPNADNNKSGIRFCTVFEVLKDETPCLGRDREESEVRVGVKRRRKTSFAAREQRWTTFCVNGDGVTLEGCL